MTPRPTPFFLLFGLLVGGAAALACSGPDPGALTFQERSRADQGSSGGTASFDGGGSGEGGTSSGGTDGGSSGGPVDPVFGTTAFAAGTAPQQANMAGGANHNGNVEGKNCVSMGCHGGGSSAPLWAFGGTVYAAANGGATVAGAEVRVTDAAGNEFGHAYTDNNGNFWFEKVAGDIPANARVGVRDATKKNVMSGTVSGVTGGDCNASGCHGNTAMRVFLN